MAIDFPFMTPPLILRRRRLLTHLLTPLILATGALSSALAETSATNVPATIAESAPAGAPVPASPAVAEPPSNALAVPGKEGWLFSAQELQHLTKPKYWADGDGVALPGDPMPAILDFKRQLDAAGIDLLLVPVPAKAVIYSDKLADASGTNLSAGYDQAFYRALESNGVKVLDLTAPFQAARSSTAPALYCKQDTHWSPEGIRIAADLIAARVKGFPAPAGLPQAVVTPTNVQVTIKGDLAEGITGSTPEEEKLTARFVGAAAGGPMKPVEPSRTSPVVLLGDSHNLIFHSGGDMHATGCGLADQLCLALGYPVDLVAVRGSGATSARRNLARRKDNLAGKRLVVWCFTSREFTEGEGWTKVPVVKVPAAAAASPQEAH